MSGAMAAGLISFAVMALLMDRRRDLAMLETLSTPRRRELLSIYAMLAVSAAFCAAVSAIAFAPHRSMAVRLACAWLLGAVPMTLSVSLFALMVGGPSTVGEAFDALRLCSDRIFLACAAVPLASALLAYALAPLQSRLTRFAARHFRRAQTLNHTGLQQA
jgi:hypothetical protein